MTAPIGCLDEREAFEAGRVRMTLVAEIMRYVDAYAYDYKAEGKLAKSRRGVENAILAALSASRQEVYAPSDLAARFVEQHDALRRALEVIAVGDSADPVRDAGDELVALGIWSGNALEQHRAMLAAAPHQSQEAQGDRHGE